jgi:outer membrane lipoprotein-sorting protein
MKKILFLFVLSIISVFVSAQDAVAILDRTSAALKATGGMKVDFTIKTGDFSSKGYIKSKGNKFVLHLEENIIWFDGETLWNYVLKNEEVNITIPSQTEMSKLNPYAFLSFYKKGYKVKKGKGTAKEHEVIMEGDKTSQYKKVVIRIDKKTYYPAIIHMESAQGNFVADIQCDSYQKNQMFSDKTFQFDQKKYPDVDVIDLR